MKPLFSINTQGFNLPQLPPLHLVTTSDESYLPLAIRSLSGQAFDLVVYHCNRRPLPVEVATIFEVKRVAKGAVVLYHYGSKKRAKRYRWIMHLLGYLPSSLVGFVSVWDAPEDFHLPKCKIKEAREDLPKFCRKLVAPATRVLEILPEKGILSWHAIQQGIPVTVLALGEETTTRIRNRLVGDQPG